MDTEPQAAELFQAFLAITRQQSEETKALVSRLDILITVLTEQAEAAPQTPPEAPSKAAFRKPLAEPLPEPVRIDARCPVCRRPGDVFIWYLQQPELGPEALTMRAISAGIEHLRPSHAIDFTQYQISGVPIGLHKMHRRDEIIVIDDKPKRYRAIDTRPDALAAPPRIEVDQEVADYVADLAAWLDTEMRESPWSYLAQSALEAVLADVMVLTESHPDERPWALFRSRIAQALASDYRWRKTAIEERDVWLID